MSKPKRKIDFDVDPRTDGMPIEVLECRDEGHDLPRKKEAFPRLGPTAQSIELVRLCKNCQRYELVEEYAPNGAKIYRGTKYDKEYLLPKISRGERQERLTRAAAREALFERYHQSGIFG